MTSKDFIIWLKGFTEGVHQYNITPVQWETLKEQLNKVDDTPYVSDNFTIGPDGAYERDPNQPSFGTPNFTYTTGSAGWRYTTTDDKTLLHD
jgi:cellobiose phosphorylase